MDWLPIIYCLQVVTADGQLITANEEHADLLWGLRGGGNFGVVVSWSIACIHSQPCYRDAALSLEQARTVLHRFNEFIATAPMN